MKGEDPKEILEIIISEEIKLPPFNSTKFTSNNPKFVRLQKEKFKDPPDSIEKREEDEINPDNSTLEREKVTSSPIIISTPFSIEIKEEELVVGIMN